jgi:predicted PurR-regulated permease PerM
MRPACPQYLFPVPLKPDTTPTNEPGQKTSSDTAFQTSLFTRRRAEKFGRYSLILIVLAAGAVFVTMIKAFLVPMILAGVFAGLFYPFYTWLLKVTHGRKALSSFACCAVLSLGLLVPAYAVANLVAREAVRIYQSAQTKGNEIFGGNLRERLRAHPLAQRLQLDKIPIESTVDRVAGKGMELIANGINVASRETFELISIVFVTFFTMFYFFRDGPQIVTKLKYYSPLADYYEEELIHRFLSVSRATIKGTLLVALLKGTLGGLTFWAFGVQAPALWGVVMVFLSVLPIVGPWIVMYPAALIMMLSGQVWAGVSIFLIATLVISSLDNLLEPILIGRDAGMHDLLVFFSMLGGIGLFGIMGFIVGPVIAASFVTLLEIYGKEFNKQLTLVHRSPGRANPPSSEM